MGKEILAVHEKELKEYLKNLGILEKMEKGEVFCYFCQEKITFENLYCLFPYEGEIKMCCNKIDCIKKVKTLLESKNDL